MNVGGTTGSGSITWDGEMNPRLKLTAVPYAMNAKTAGSLTTSSGANIATLEIDSPTSGNQTFHLQDQGAPGSYNLVTDGNATSLLGGYFIQNQVAAVQTGNINIRSAGTGSVTVALQAVTSQTADLIQFRNSGGSAVSGINAAGELYYANSGFTATISTNTLTADRRFILPDTALATTASPGTICVFNGTSSNCPAATGSAYYIQNQNASAQTADYWINGTARVDVAVVAPSLDTAAAGSLTIGGTNAATVNIANNNIAHTVNIATGTSTQAVTIGSTSSASSLSLLAGSAGFNLAFVGVPNAISTDSLGRTAFRTGSDVSGIFKVQDSAGVDLFSIDANTGARLTNVKSDLLVDGGVETLDGYTGRTLTLNTTSTVNYTTPGGASVGTKISISGYDPAAYQQVIAIGVTSAANSNARVLSIFDQRSGAHQPSIALFSPDENQVGGLSYEGTNTTLTLKNSADGINFNVNSLNALSILKSGTDSVLRAGVVSSSTGKIELANAGSANVVTLQSSAQSGDYTLSIPTLAANDTVCTYALQNCPASGPAGGDLSGTYPNPTVAAIQGRAVAYTAIAGNDLMVYNGTSWVNAAQAGDVTGTLSGNTLTYAIGVGKVTSTMILDNTISNADLATGSFAKITGVGALTSGSLASGFGTINIASSIATSSTITGGSSLTLGVGGSAAGQIVLHNATNSNTVTIQSDSQTGNTTITIPTITGASDTICFYNLGNCAATGAGFIQNQYASQQNGNAWVSGNLRADTAVVTPALRPTADGVSALKIQNAAGTTDIITVDSTNSTVKFKAGTDTSVLGSELYGGGNFSSGWTTTGWDTTTIVTRATHTAGNTSPLINTSVAITGGTRYQVSFNFQSGTCSGGAGESLAVRVGGVLIGTLTANSCNVTNGYVFVGQASNTDGVTFTPTSGWVGGINSSTVSIKTIGSLSNPSVTIQNVAGAANIEIRASNSTTNTFIGLSSGAQNNTGIQNVSLGSSAFQSNTAGSNSVAIGYRALQSNTNGVNNTAVGWQSLMNNISGVNNTAIGLGSMQNNVNGSGNLGVGYNTLSGNISGGGNVALGQGAASGNITGSNNIAIGRDALMSNAATDFNVAVGYYSLRLATGTSNTAIGTSSLAVLTSGTSNAAVGYSALGATNTGGGNASLGYNSLLSNTTGSNNSALGFSAGYRDQVTAFATLSGLQRASAIGAYAQVQASDSIVLGSVDYGTKVGIGITVPSNTFSVFPFDYKTGTATRTNGSAVLTGTGTTWTAAMVGDLIVFPDGTTNTIASFTSATSITMGASYGGTTDAAPINYRFHKVGLQVTSAGQVGVNTTTPNASYQMDVNGAFNATTLYQNGVTLSSSFIQNQAASAQTSAGFWMQNAGRSDTSFLAPLFDAATGVTLGIGTTNATSITIGRSAIGTVLASSTLTAGTSGSTTTLEGAGQATTNAAGNDFVIRGSAGNGSGNGGTLSLSGGSSASGAQGLVSISTTAFNSSATVSFGASGTLNSFLSGAVNNYSSVRASATTTALTLTVDAPTITTVGRLLYLSNVGSNDFNILLNGTGITIALKPNSTATLIWNGNGWTAAGASSSTDLQSAYNNTLTSAGGAELILNPAGAAADGLTIRNNGATPLSGGLLEVQTSIGTNLFSVNSYGTELASNGGAETAGVSSTTFPASTWTAQNSSTVSRTITTGEYQTGQAGVKVATTAVNQGVRNQLAANPVASTTYTVSFTAASSTAGQNTTPIEVIYSHDNGVTLTNVCQGFGGGYTTSRPLSNYTGYNWTKVTCTVTTTGASVTTPLLIIRQTDAATRTLYVDNLSFIRNDSTTRPASVQMGGGNTGGQVTLFTLDRSSTAPLVSNGDDRYLGSMYFDTTLGNIQCYEADGWGACGSAPDNIVTLTPEYSNAVLSAPGTLGGTFTATGVGTLTADFCSNQSAVLQVNTSFCASGISRNYYRWTSPQASAQTYSVYVSYKLPSTFKTFYDDNTIKLTGLRDHSTNSTAALSVFRSTGSAVSQCGSTTTVTTANNSWTTSSLTGNETSCGFAAGDVVLFKIDVTAQSNANVYVENLEFRYTNK